jgi:hypothetical protein
LKTEENIFLVCREVRERVAERDGQEKKIELAGAPQMEKIGRPRPDRLANLILLHHILVDLRDMATESRSPSYSTV